MKYTPVKLRCLVAAAAAVAALAGCATSQPQPAPAAKPAAAAVAKPAAPAAAKDIPIRVATYNIRLSGRLDRPADGGTPNAWDERKEDTAALIKKMDLDVFGLQEVCPRQLKFLKEKLPGYEFVGEHRNADRKSGEASPVCYRKDRFDRLDAGTFWLSETPDVPGVKGWGAACPRVCSYLVLRDRKSGKKLCFANTHTDHISALAREKGMLLVIERMAKFGGGCPIVFTGDHNCNEMQKPSRAVSEILSNALYVSETPPKGPWRTFNGWQWRDNERSAAEALTYPQKVRNARGGSPDGDKARYGAYIYQEFGSRIDYVYVSPSVRVLDVETYADPRPGRKLYPSDHFPVAATIVL